MFLVDAPVVAVGSSPSSLFTGDSLYLTCSISLTSELVSGTSLQIIWTLPNNSIIVASSYNNSNSSGTVEGGGLSYSSVVHISHVLRANTGIYNCLAKINSTHQFIQSDSAMSSSSTSVTVQGQLIRNTELFKQCLVFNNSDTGGY